MIADLKPYAEYKDSGLPWLGQVPAHWQIVRSKRLFTPRKELARPDDVQLSATQAYGVIPQSDYEARTGYRVVKISMHLDRRRHVEADDFVISMRSFQGGLERAWSSGAIRSSYVVLKPERQLDPGYFRHLFKSAPYIAALRATGDFIRDGQDLNYGNFCAVDVPLMPLAEQVAIGRLLEWANGRVERAMRAKRKVIALLMEQKQTTIRQAVTRGVDRFVPFKPSGVNWLGEIPKHWQVRKLKFLVTSVGGMTPNKSTTRFWGGRVPWVSPKDMKVREIVDSRDHITEAALRSTGISLVPPPAVLIVVRGMILARTFPAALTTVAVTVNQDMKALVPTSCVNASFLVSLLTGIQHDLLELVEEAGHGTRCLRTDSWANFSVPLPPIREQNQINDVLTAQLAGVNSAISRLDSEIGLLREYRARLVGEVVTGKLDVRQAAMGLRDEGGAEADDDLSVEPDEAELADKEATEA